jgi:hypothetical protein
VACKVLVEKILEVGDQRSIAKIFFVTAGVQNIGIGIAILAFFLASSNFHKIKIATVNLKSSILVWGTKKFHKKKLKSPKDMLKWSNFRRSLGGSQGRGWCMDPTHAPPPPSIFSLQGITLAHLPLKWHNFIHIFDTVRAYPNSPKTHYGTLVL